MRLLDYKKCFVFAAANTKYFFRTGSYYQGVHITPSYPKYCFLPVLED